jgi:hypothetical protein
MVPSSRSEPVFGCAESIEPRMTSDDVSIDMLPWWRLPVAVGRLLRPHIRLFAAHGMSNVST